MLYWYAKAQLTLIDRQHSLNKYTLSYIYTELLQISLSKKQMRTLQLLQKYRDIYQSGAYLDSECEVLSEHFETATTLIPSNSRELNIKQKIGYFKLRHPNYS